MTLTLLVLTEDSLTESDVEHIHSLHPDDTVTYRVLVPADTERNVLVTLLDQLSLADFRDALDTVLGREPEGEEARVEAQERLDRSLVLLRKAGLDATGSLTQDDPLPALEKGVAAGADEIVIVTYPHALEDTFRRDWASRAREHLDVPVLHIYRGTSILG